MENTCPFHIVFQFLNIHLTQICKIEPPDLLFLAFISFCIRQVQIYTIFHKSLELHSILSIKRFLSQTFLLKRFTQPSPPLLNGQNFLSMLPYLEVSLTHNTVQLGWDGKNQQPKYYQEGARPHQKVKIPKIIRTGINIYSALVFFTVHSGDIWILLSISFCLAWFSF